MKCEKLYNAESIIKNSVTKKLQFKLQAKADTYEQQQD